jgi:NAD(P)H dehydrogenase (quinone)
MTVSVVVAYHSGYGHTARVAEAVFQGANMAGARVALLSVDALSEADWAALDAADAIVFGSPTYMGSVSAPFKAFMDAASGRWLKQAWKNKIAGGFTNASAYSGDMLSTLFQLSVNAAQHGMIWVGNDVLPTGGARGAEGAKPTDLNRVGSFLGVMTQSNNDAPEVTPPSGDIETAKLFGARIVALTLQFKAGSI